MLTHDWPVILAASRHLLDECRSCGHLLTELPHSPSRTQLWIAESVQRRLRGPASAARFRLARDIRTNDSNIRVEHDADVQNDSRYHQAFFSAHQEAEDRLLEEAWRRVWVWQEPVVIGEKLVGSVSKHSDRLLMLLLQYYSPEKFGHPGRRRRNWRQSSDDTN
jgi:hypothetical protein